MKWLRKAIRAAFAVSFLFLFWKSGIVSVFSVPVDLNVQPDTEATTVIDQSGRSAFQIHATGNDAIPLSEIPLRLQQAFISAEDARFYEEPLGIDLRGIARALVEDIRNGNTDQGASTIPEQLAKISFLNDQKTLSYKIKQVLLGIKISLRYSKSEILNMYLNRVYLGEGATGVAEAAAVYFDKPVNQLSLAQMALLAGLPQAPSYYDPYIHPEAAKSRRETVLAQMYKYGYITKEQWRTALAEPIALKKGFRDGLPPADAAYEQYLFEEADRIGIGASTLKHGGLTIYTDLNPRLQESLYRAFTDPKNFPPDMNGAKVQSGAVFLDAHSGGVVAIMNGRGIGYRGFDHATMTRRSPGSAIKPIVVYGPAIDSGRFTADSALYDGPMDIDGYTPKDWKAHPVTNDTVTLKEALDMSWNIPAVWLLRQMGTDTGIAFGTLAGLHFTPQDAEHLGIALGGLSHGVSPLEMADAYLPFDNGGIRIQAHAIEKIVNQNGEVVYQADPEQVRVMKTTTATEMTRLLRSVVEEGIGRDAAVPGVLVAGKTGSTPFDHQTGDQDVWFCGYTPRFVGSIWMGFDITDNQHYILPASGGSAVPARLFRTVIQSYIGE